MLDWPIITGALWLGVLTSISPCPLAMNVAAIAFLSRSNNESSTTFWNSIAYICGRAAAYILLATVLAAGVTSAPKVTSFFSSALDGLLGPAILIVGMLVAGWLPVKLPSSGGLNALGTKLASKGRAGEFMMGAIFAVAFCPVSAALFFGGLIPASVQSNSPVLVPLIYGVGTALPVVIAVGLIAGGISQATKRLQNLQRVGAKLQQGTGMVLVGVGSWLTIADMMR